MSKCESKTRPVLFRPAPGRKWLNEADSIHVRESRRCIDCNSPLTIATPDRIGTGPHARKMTIYLHFDNVHFSGGVTKTGLELYFCSHCYCEFVYGPRTGDGFFRVLRLPRTKAGYDVSMPTPR